MTNDELFPNTTHPMKYLLLQIILLMRSMLAVPRLVRRRLPRVAFNAAPNPDDAAVILHPDAVAINDASQEAWHRLSPWGVYAHSLGRQMVNKDTVAEMVAAFNSERLARGDNWRGVPIYPGHPDRPDAPKGTVKKKIGSVMAMDIRADGLYVQTAWNSKGKENILEGECPYPSPVWRLKDGPNGSKVPVKLLSVGMVPDPNIVDADAWTNEATPEAAKEDPAPDITPALSFNDALQIIVSGGGMGSDKEEVRSLRAKLWLPEDATIDQVKAALATRLAEHEAAKARLTECETEIAALKDQVAAEQAKAATATTAMNDAIRDAAITVAINEGRATEGERAALLTAFNDGFDTALTALNSRRPKLDVKPAALDVRMAHEARMGRAAAQTAFNDAVSAHMKAPGKDYQTAFNDCFRSPEHAALIAALNTPAVA